MNNKKIIFVVFILVAMAQLFVPAKMIFDREDILATGKEYKFRTAPVDPNDPFRGKFITLDFEDNMLIISSEEGLVSAQIVFVIITNDADGYAIIESISQEEPINHQNYIKAKVAYVSSVDEDDLTEITINYPFDRYYMEESKAHDAEVIYNQSQPDSSQTAYALVAVKNGETVLKDVLIDGISISNLVNKEMK